MPIDYDVVIVFGTLFLSLVAMLVYAAWHQQLKHKTKKGDASSNSMRASELEELIYKAVTNATRPLEIRMDDLEAEMRALGSGDESHARLTGRPEEPLLGMRESEQHPVPAQTRRR